MWRIGFLVIFLALLNLRGFQSFIIFVSFFSCVTFKDIFFGFFKKQQLKINHADCCLGFKGLKPTPRIYAFLYVGRSQIFLMNNKNITAQQPV